MKDALRSARSQFGLLLVFLVSCGTVLVPRALAQEAADTTSAETGFGSDGGFLLWDLIGEAGGFQYPIFGLLAIGLFLISAKLYELYKDQKAAEELENASLEEMEMKRIAMLVANQEESMLAELEATMINVFQTTEDADTLHEEIANYIQFQRDRFDIFRSRIDFLADTAGAIGLLGTVWGILTVFTGGGIDDEQRVLAGMGVALISTLLGLVVSITLNLISTEVYSFFDDRLEQIEDKADELRFRLLELGFERKNGSTNGSEEAVADQARSSSVASAVPEGREPASAREEASGPRSGPAQQTRSAGDPESSGAGFSEEQSSEEQFSEEDVAYQLRAAEQPREAVVAETLTDIPLQVKAKSGEPVSGEEVQVRVRSGEGKINGTETEITRRSDEEGRVAFDWHMPESPETCELQATVLGSDEPEASCSLSVAVEPGPPRHYKQDGDNQGAKVGNKVPNPFAIKLVDKYQNPVPGCKVKYSVESGKGKFENGNESVEVVTDNSGVAAVDFFVGDEPGLNQVTAKVGNEETSFQAMALE